ncbi:hypothetical protein [Brachybacterium sp. YJGR34]|uniref:hypothetical protein n=1 Tax=Brachybacterium sp. YJGR34 TaxID=2059911 RepID=UPI0013001EF3|nr:hypothetical protein [Brachybacterium sp. YJGR34]
MADWLGTTLLGAMSAVLLVSGIMAYRGTYVSWLALKSFFPGWPGLAGLYLGIAFADVLLMRALLDAALDGPLLLGIVYLLLFGILVASAMIGLIGMFWLPRFLLPLWVRETIDEIRRGEDPLSQALRPGGSLYGRLGVPRPRPPRPRGQGGSRRRSTERTVWRARRQPPRR